MSGEATNTQNMEASYNAQYAISTVREGYKQTEEGVIPEDWELVPLSQTAHRITRGASPRPIESPAWFDLSSSVGWVRISDLTRSGRFLSETAQKLSEAGIRRSRPVSAGSLIMSICATVGRPIETAIDVCIHDGFVVFEQPKVDQSFLYHLLVALEPTWSKRGQTGSQMNLNTRVVNGCLVPIPSSKEEQSAIANMLSEVDSLLEQLERLIAKKKAIKTATMQQLLTGRTRLPQFAFREDGKAKGYKVSDFGKIPEDWKIVELREVSQFINGRAFALHEWRKSGAPVIRLQNLTGRGEDYYYSNLQLPEKQYCHKGDLLFMWSATFGPIIWNGDKAIFHYHIWKIECKSGYMENFLYFLLSDMTEKLKSGSSSGGTMLHVTKGTMESTLAAFPGSEEQKAIAEVLSSMDEEIRSLEERLSKTRDIKQGMMQELLTGKTRLI